MTREIIPPCEHVIALIKAFQKPKPGRTRDETTWGKMGTLTLTFGYGYDNRESGKVVVHHTVNGKEAYEIMSVEDAADVYCAYYGLA